MTPALALLLLMTAEGETVIRAPRAVDEEVRFLDESSRSSVSPEEALEEIEGVSLVRDGGPLSPARVTRRGLSGARAPISLEGLPLGDPASGAVDVAALPFGALDRAVLGRGLSRAFDLSLRSADDEGEVLEARALAGAFGTARAGVLSLRGPVLLAAEVATTGGEFEFALPTPSGTLSRGLRLNNDQVRAGALAATTALQTRFVTFANVHSGGVPGFATAPRLDLRGLRSDLGARAQTQLGPFKLSADLRSGYRSTTERSAGGAVTSGASSLALEWTDLGLGLSLTGSAGVDGVVEAALVRPRLGAGGRGAWQLGAIHLELAGSGALVGETFLPAGQLAASTEVARGWRTGARISRTARPPTLDELFAPGGFVLGNVDLEPESATDAELWTDLKLGRTLSARATLWGGRLDEAILFLNRNAFEVQPVNSGGAWRAGLEIHARVRPHPLAELRLTGDALVSRLDATHAPLPSAPQLRALLAAAVGPSGARLVARLRTRGASTANLFGTLVIPAYALVDVAAELELRPGFSLTGELRNALDERSAVDVNLLPLPGRALFVGVELRS